MIGGSGEKKTLRTVARYADMWNAMGPLDMMAHKIEVLRGHCDAVGRDIAEIEFTLGVQGRRSATPRPRPTASGRPRWPTTGRRWPMSRTTTPSGTARPSRSPTGCGRTSSWASGRSSPSSRRPYDVETLERFIGEVVPLI